MKQYVGFVLFLMATALASDAVASSPSIFLSPKKVGPGDIMVVTVKNSAGPVEGSFNGKRLYFNPAKHSLEAVVGIDLKTEPGTYPLEVVIDGVRTARDVVIAKKKYPVQRLTLPEDKHPEGVGRSPLV